MNLHRPFHTSTLLEPSYVTLFPLEDPVVIGGTVTLWCAATQVTRAPDFQWTLPGGITHSTPPETEDSSTTSLALKEIKTSQAGQYNCTATVIGSKTDSTYIVVQSKCP